MHGTSRAVWIMGLSKAQPQHTLGMTGIKSTFINTLPPSSCRIYLLHIYLKEEHFIPCKTKKAKVTIIQKSILKNDPSIPCCNPDVPCGVSLMMRLWHQQVTAGYLQQSNKKTRTTKGHRKYQCEIQEASYNPPSFYLALTIWYEHCFF